jgi:hypothetical protein
VEGIPYETYNVYVYYAGADSVNPQAVEANGVSRYVLKDEKDYPGTWTVSEAAVPEDAEEANVLLWRNLSGSTLTIEAPVASTRPTLLGFQIVDREGADDAPPETSILAPANGAVFESGDAVVLSGEALQGGDPLDDPFLQWVSDVEGPLGTGASLEVNDLSVGPHTLTLTGLNESGLSSTDSIDIEILPPPQPPVLLTQTDNQNLFEGGTVELAAEFIATPPIDSYQWYKDGEAVAPSARNAGTTSATLTLTETVIADSGSYTLEATNSLGTTTAGPILLGVEEIPDLDLLLDFGNKVDDPEGNWNTIAAGDTHGNLVHAISGDPVPNVVLENENTGGSGLQLSNSTDTWGARTVAPDWSDPNALSDRMWVDSGDSATLTLRNLQPGKVYDIEIASSFAAGGDSGSKPGIFQVTGASGLVEGVNAHTGERLGTEVYWTSRGPDDGGDDHSAEGWLKWSAVSPDAEGNIEILLEATTDGKSRVSVNAVRILDVSEVEAEIEDLSDWRSHYFPETGENDHAGDLANPSGDGVVNLMKYALGLDPTVPLSPQERNRLLLVEASNIGAQLQLSLSQEYQRMDIRYQMELSEDLVSWDPLAVAVAGGPFLPAENAPVEFVDRNSDSVSVFLSETAPDPGFFRLNVEVYP